MKNILITGASGFIGQSVFHLLKKEKFKVVGVSVEGGQIDKEKIFKLDLCDSHELSNFFKKKNAVEHFETIVHLAARVPQTNSEEEQKLSLIDNITSTLNILEEFKRSKTREFIFASGISVAYQLDSLYVLSKYFSEILSQYYQKNNKEVVVLRISAPYGPGQKPNNVIPIFINNALSNKEIQIFGSGKRSQDFIYVDDIARAFLAAVKVNCSGIYNIGSGQSTSTLQLAKTILKNFPQSKSKITFKGVDPEENYRIKIDINKTKKNLKFIPEVTIGEGIKKYIEYLKDNVR